jgi:hypothetical protein
MKKPEFPKPRLIREDFLPEQDPLMNYRIKKITKPDGEVRYCPQKKIFGLLWWEICGFEGYSTESRAQRKIFDDYNKTLKDKVEFLKPDSSKTVPKPPPNLRQ